MAWYRMVSTYATAPRQWRADMERGNTWEGGGGLYILVHKLLYQATVEGFTALRQMFGKPTSVNIFCVEWRYLSIQMATLGYVIFEENYYLQPVYQALILGHF